MEPLVSIIIPVYNRQDTIMESINSVLKQSYKNMEILVIDDGSTDNTEYVVKQIKDNRILYYKQPQKGACAARNKGILLAQGKYIAFNDSDDVWYENKLQNQIQCLETNSADIVFGKLKETSSGKIVPSHISYGLLPQNVDLSGIGTQTLIAKADVLKNNLFNERLPRLQELELLIRLHLKYKIYCIDEPVVKWRIQNDSISKNINKLYLATQIILNEDNNKLENIPKTKGTILGYLATCKAYQGIDDYILFRDAYKLKGRRLDYIKMILARVGILSRYYKRFK